MLRVPLDANHPAILDGDQHPAHIAAELTAGLPDCLIAHERTPFTGCVTPL
jgi:hypothetical protein